MKRKSILITIIAILAFIPIMVNAEVHVLNLRDTLEEKGITISDENYKETEDQIKIYLFRWSNCIHCYDFLNYLNSILPEYGYMFKLRSYETSTNSDNEAIMAKIQAFFKESDNNGVPYIIIGNKTIYGYSSRMDETILSAIQKEYKSKKRYDVFDEMEKKENGESSNDGLYIIIPIILIIVAIIIVSIRKKQE